ncbi:response regulator [Stakelama sp. CBK3Z-3]|uniref:Response regulator n=1 Tax=Stakelama flava TaxID=2860338 RepID=A0ABS6XMX0_9SPHN|nr:response regulator [Stakelama flava]MBW4331557.1 response regulator [Stakelama flava]
MTDSRSQAESRQLLLIEDDAKVRRSLHLLLQSEGYEVRSFPGIGALLAESLARTAPYLVTDYRLSDGDGIGVLRALRGVGWQGRAVLITGFATEMLREAAMACGFHHIVEKPLRRHDLLRALSA